MRCGQHFGCQRIVQSAQLRLQYSPESSNMCFIRPIRRNAWFESIEFFRQYSHFRGELHEVFEAIHAKDEGSHTGLVEVEADIWGTWADVEASMQHHGVSTKQGE